MWLQCPPLPPLQEQWASQLMLVLHYLINLKTNGVDLHFFSMTGNICLWHETEGLLEFQRLAFHVQSYLQQLLFGFQKHSLHEIMCNSSRQHSSYRHAVTTLPRWKELSLKNFSVILSSFLPVSMCKSNNLHDLCNNHLNMQPYLRASWNNNFKTAKKTSENLGPQLRLVSDKT